MKKNVLVIGTGTIGEPLIGLLSDFKDQLEINVFFHKRTPLEDEVAKVNSLLERGAKLVVDQERTKEFQDLGHEPDLNYEAALNISDVIIDCTPAGNLAKEEHYLPLLKENFCATREKKKVFIAQGSEKNFGVPFAFGINDEILLREQPQFIQVVSCNTHNISSIVDTLSSGDMLNIISGDFTCIRRANDISQEDDFIASPEVGQHKDSVFGTHHARDSYDLFSTLYQYPNLFSSALKINSQYMHILRFCVEIKGSPSKKDVLKKFDDNKFIALTKKNLTNKVFSFGRDHGYYGRIFNHTVIAENSLILNRVNGNTKVTGFCFTPQDGNSILSSVAAALHAVHGKRYKELMTVFDKFLFNYV